MSLAVDPVTYVDRSHPEHRGEVAEQLVGIARAIRAWQDRTSPRLSDEAMVKRYRGLGSTKTYRRLVKGDTSSLDLDKQLANYRGVERQIAEVSGSDGQEEIYEELTPTFEVAMAVSTLLRQRGNERVVLVEGPTGAGKTKALEYVASTFPGEVVRIEATDAWSSLNVMMGDFLVALGCYKDEADDLRRMPGSTGGRLQEVIAELSRHRRILLLDEGHHMVAGGLNLLKSMLNKTDSVLVIACIDTLWTKLAAKAWREAAQLVLNRLHERVRLAPPSADDVEFFLAKRIATLNGGDWKKACGKIAEKSENGGSFAFLRRLANRANAMGAEPDAGQLLAAADEILESLRTR